MSNDNAAYSAPSLPYAEPKKLPYQPYNNTPRPVTGWLLKQDGHFLLKQDGGKFIL